MLTKIVDAFPDKPWHWMSLLTNPNITYDYIQLHSKYPWSRDRYSFGDIFSRNPGITMNFVKAHPEIYWDHRHLACNSGITEQDIENHYELLNRKNYIAENPNLTMNFILKHQDIFKDKQISRYLGGTTGISKYHFLILNNILKYFGVKNHYHTIQI